MPGQKIYYIPPRLAGPVPAWSGKAAPAAASSWLLDHAEGLGFNAVWFSPLTVATNVEKQMHGRTVGGSYYAIRDHFRLDPEFSTGDDAADRDHLRHFCKTAADKGMRVYADLVFNHVAADHPLVAEEDRDIARILANAQGPVEQLRSDSGKLIGLGWEEGGVKKDFYFKFRRDDDFSLQVGGPAEDPWSDIAQVNYSSPAARKFFVEGEGGKPGYFAQVIDWYMDLGFTGFRCDVAYMIPPESWRSLIGHARDRNPDIVFMAETLGANEQKVERMARATVPDGKGGERPAFDYGMLGFFWWDFEHDWLPQGEHPRVAKMSKYGGAGSPDNHDTADTLAGAMQKAFNAHARRDDVVADISMRNFALSALAGNAYYMQMGYEFCNERQNHVFRGQVKPEDWQGLVKERAGTTLDLRGRIRDINALKDRLGVENCVAHFREYTAMDNGRVVKIHCEYVDADTQQKKADVVLLMNRKPEHGPVRLPAGVLPSLRAQGLFYPATAEGEALRDVMICHTPLSPVPAARPAPATRRHLRFGA